MEFSAGHAGRKQEIRDLFTEVFTASEGADEGEAIGAFVEDLIETTADDDLFVFTAHENGLPVGSIAFSRLSYDQDDRTVFILSPVAVKTDRQKQGVGQKLIAFGLRALRRQNVDVAITYGDPEYYCKTGFMPIAEAAAQPPLGLSHPHGWLGRSLSGEPLTPLVGPSRCVDALNKPDLW